MNSTGTALFVSPHFDDVTLSCGGTVALQAQSGQSIVMTVFAGEPPRSLNEFARFQHDRWGTADDTVDVRRDEDRVALEILGATSHMLDVPDAIYRGSLYLSDEDLFGPVKPEDAAAQTRVADAIVEATGELGVSQVFLPLGIGGHVDHRICYAVAPELLSAGYAVYFYEDFPYAVSNSAFEQRMSELDHTLEVDLVDIAAVVERRIAAIRAYASQVATIFRNYGPAETVVRNYASGLARGPGAYVERLWRLPGQSPLPLQAV